MPIGVSFGSEYSAPPDRSTGSTRPGTRLEQDGIAAVASPYVRENGVANLFRFKSTA